MIHIDISAVESSLLLSEYGERMHWSCSIPNMDFDPGDNYPLALRINCLNSVDATTVLEITFGWYRLVCSNGLMFGLGNARLRRRHIQSLDPEDIALYLRGQIEQVPAEKGLYPEWLRCNVNARSLTEWIDQKVAKEWGPHAGARVWNIITEGLDGEVERVRNFKPHQLPIKNTRTVSGACAPAQNLFHISQALSWIARTRQTIPEQLDYVGDIPRLMEPLMEHIPEFNSANR